MKRLFEIIGGIGFVMLIVGCIAFGTVPGYSLMAVGMIALLVGANKAIEKETRR